MYQLPHDEHVLMGWFYNPTEDKVYDTVLYSNPGGTREDRNYFMNAIHRLNGFGYIESEQHSGHYPFYCRLTEQGKTYRRRWYPTKAEQVESVIEEQRLFIASLPEVKRNELLYGKWIPPETDEE